ncbi:hypothetical protein F5884DRAFT_670309 [Xylogone sp. PMI_703]|nr:hypothetical protein F5884DRAFT_670309 [Xylogone sp. PMI_703]
MSAQLRRTNASVSTSIEARFNVPLVLRPLLRAYVLGYASSTLPRIITLLLTHLTRHRRKRPSIAGDKKPDVPFLTSLKAILSGALECQRFPAFCATLIPLRKVIGKLLKGWSGIARQRLSVWLATFIAAWLSLSLLQSKKSDAYIDYVSDPDVPEGSKSVRPVRFAGRTMDLTLFAVCRGLDVIIGELWSQRKARRIANCKWTKLESSISALTDSTIFAASSALIMWAFMYTPSRLPGAYNKWIASAAQVDQRLLIALRRMRWGDLVYGVETGQAELLESMCADYNLPLEYGDPVKSIPIPCELVHMGRGTSCEYHALSRLLRSVFWAFSTYLPLNLLLVLRNPSRSSFKSALKSSLRSSSFLATFIALFYYGVCLARTRLGPRILGTSLVTRRQIDSGLCVSSGCALCGWSILLENPGRRKDIALFVAPRALATLLPRRYDWEKRWRETAAFGAATAVVFTCVKERPERVRGVLGKVLKAVLVV